MKKLLIMVILCLTFVLSGCAVMGYTSYMKDDPTYDYSSDPYYPPGKTDETWVKDEKQCHTESGRIPALLPFSIINFMNGANTRYNACMKEMGWE